MRLIALVLAGQISVAATAPAASAAPRDVLYVGNNWDGTVDVVDPNTFERLDADQHRPRQARSGWREIAANPDRSGYFLAIRSRSARATTSSSTTCSPRPTGASSTSRGRASRTSSRSTCGRAKIVWRVPVDGYRSDHMAISPDGRRLLVSASTARKVHVIDTATGKIVGEFASGDSPHENNYSRDGKLIYHASIGRVYTPTDDPALGRRRRASASSRSSTRGRCEILKRIDMGEKLEEAGYPGHELRRPADGALARRALRLLPGLLLPRLRRVRPRSSDKVPRSRELPLARRGGAAAPRGVPARLGPPRHRDEPAGDEALRRRDDVRLRGDRRRDRRSRYKIIDVGEKPYWSTNSGDGRYCFVSVSGDDRVVGDLLRAASEIAQHPGRRPPAADADGQAGGGRARRAAGRLRPARPGGPRPSCGSPCARSACAPTGRCACACA